MRPSDLLPREHGAYAQLGFPLVTGLVYGHGATGAWAFVVVALALFLANEPVAILLGVRGRRLHDRLRVPARRRLAVLSAVAALGGLLALAVAPSRAWAAALVPGGLALLLVPLVATRRVKSIAGELLVAAVLATTLLPIARSGPAPADRSLVAAAVWFAAFVTAILAVHAIKVRHKDRSGRRWTRLAAPTAGAAVIGFAVVAALAADGPLRHGLAVVPPAAVGLGLGLSPPHPRHLKRVGWTAVASDTAALALLLVLESVGFG